MTPDPSPWGVAPPVGSTPLGGGAPTSVGPGGPPSGARISGCAWAGIAFVLAVVVAVGAFVVVVLIGEDGERPASGRSVVGELEVGDCVRVPAGSETSSLVAQECAAAHEGEVFLRDVLGAGPFPGDDAAQRQAAERCLGAFEGYVGAAYADSELEVTVTSPTGEQWAAGDRAFACIAHDGSGAQLPPGSVRDTAR